MQIFTHPKYISKFIIIIIIKLKYHETGESTSMIKVGEDGAACLLNTKIKKIFDEGLGAARGFLSFPPLAQSSSSIIVHCIAAAANVNVNKATLQTCDRGRPRTHKSDAPAVHVLEASS